MAKLGAFGGMVASLVALALSGCNSSVDMNEQEAHAKARSLPLEERYDLYYRVYISRIPRNPALVNDVVELGSVARSYAFKMAKSGKGPTFSAALEVISAFRQECTPQEMRFLVQAVERSSTGASQLKARKDSINSVCTGTPPPGWR